MLFAAFCIVCLLAIGIKLAVDRKRATAKAPESPLFRIGPVVLPTDRYYHPGHTWAKPVGADEVLVGMDDFARRFVGRLKAVVTPGQGEKLEQGKAAWTIEFDGRKLEQPSPVDGEVVEVNENVLRDLDKLAQDPYETGWLLKVRTERTERLPTNLFGADLARKWVELAIQELQRSFSPLAGAVSQDGGELAEGVGRMLSDEDWERVAKRFFPVSK